MRRLFSFRSRLPESWDCNVEYYGANDGCDCGRNALDPDCASLSSTECDYQYCDGTDGSNANNNTLCERRRRRRPS
ncbi:MAG: hypothetical protein JKY37_08235 [Nannocystaceae bacterium]|nr:hypothetical protein [Nannocystaceae bacterium]